MILCDALKEATHSLHMQAHDQLYFKDLFKNKVPMEAFATQIRALWAILATLERTIAYCDDEKIRSFSNHYIAKTPLLQTDALYLEQKGIQSVMPATQVALDICDEIITLSTSNSYALLGYLYVLEGSTNGAQITLKQIKKSFEFEPSYFLCYGEDFKERWKKFCQALNEIEEKEHQAVIEGAQKLFTLLIKFYAALYPCQELGYHVTMCNPEAGNHSFPQDLNEIILAADVAHQCIQHAPYYKLFGDRGINFCKSDNAWLLTLCREEGIEQQVQWLADVLASKGVPSTLLEHDIKILHEAALSRFNDPCYDELLKGVKTLQQQRSYYISDAEFQNFTHRFSQPISGIGAILLGAFVDEKIGRKLALNSVIALLKRNYDEAWIEQSLATLKDIETEIEDGV